MLRIIIANNDSDFAQISTIDATLFWPNNGPNCAILSDLEKLIQNLMSLEVVRRIHTGVYIEYI